jgi:multiple sugar transport system substrate-binding protein
MVCTHMVNLKSLVFLVATLLFVQPTLSQTRIEISVFFHTGQGAERDALNTILVNFNSNQNDYIAIATELPEGSYTDQVNAAAIAGTLPCLLDFDGPTLYSFAYRGYLLPIDQFTSPELLADILPSIIQQGTYREHLYSLGIFDSGLALWGNRDYLDAASIRIPESIHDSWTLGEFNSILESLAQLGTLETPLDLKMNYGEGEWYTYGFSPLIQSFGGDLINRETYLSAEGYLNGKESIAAMTWFQNLFANDYAVANPPGDNMFVDGEAALSWVGHWAYNQYSEALGDRLVLIPMPRFGNRAATGMGSWNWGITTTCNNPQGAWSLLEFMLQEDQMTIMTEASGAIPSRLSVLARNERYTPGGELFIYVQQLQEGLAIPRPQTPAYPVITSAFSLAVNAIANGANVQATLNLAVQTIDAEIDANNGYTSRSNS